MEGVVASEREPAIITAQTDLRALAASLAVIHEVTESGLLRGDERDIVGVLRPEPAGAPSQFALPRVADTGFESSGNHLLQRRIGAAQFDGGRRAIGFAQRTARGIGTGIRSTF